MMENYKRLTKLLAPFVPLWLIWRTWKGKEDAQRIKERYGFASKSRPPGPLMWVHAASVGEANSVLPMLRLTRTQFPHITLLLTTGTVTSAELMGQRLPEDIIHQYIPIDTPQAVDRFIWHWRPDFAFWVESEFWPNLIAATNDFGSFMGVINARMSEGSLRSWQKRLPMIKSLLGTFNIMFAQSDVDAGRLRVLGAKDTMCLGNIKYDAPMLACDEATLVTVKEMIGMRPVWLAASTHPGEEEMIAQAHRLLAATRPNLLTIIVPRHPERGNAIVEALGKTHTVALRSKQDAITAGTAIYIANTLGELGLFYRVSEIVFMGGSLVEHGGQNPLESARLACVILTGPHTHNFSEIYDEMEAAGCCLRVQSAGGLAAQVDRLMNTSAERDQLQSQVRVWLKTKGGATGRILELITPALMVGQIKQDSGE